MRPRPCDDKQWNIWLCTYALAHRHTRIDTVTHQYWDTKNGDADVLGALTLKVPNADEALEHLKRGLSKRVVGKTAMNQASSRSHVVFTAIVQQTWRKQYNEKVEVEMKTSKINFVDLSGSERIKRSNTEGKRYVNCDLSISIELVLLILILSSCPV